MSAVEPLETEAAVIPVTQPSRLPAHADADATARLPTRSSFAVLAARSGPMVLYYLNRLGTLGATGVTMLLFAVIFFFSAILPQQRDVSALDAQIRNAHHLNHAAESAPVRLNRFVNTLPKRNELPKILGQVFTLAGSAGVTLDRGRYELTPTRAGHLAQYRMTFPIKGHYPDIRKFIDAVLTTVPSAALEGLRVERKAVGDESVSADLRFAVFVRNDS